MIEIVALIIISKSISKMVQAKGLKPWKYVILLIALWLRLEFLGGFIGGLVTGDVLLTYVFGLAGAALGASLGYNIAKNAQPKRQYNENILDADLVQE